MIVLPATQFTSDLDHDTDGAAALLEFRLVDTDGNEALAWSAAAIFQVTASADGPPWRYRATRTAPAATGSYTGQWRLAASPDEVWVATDPIVVSIYTGTLPAWAPSPATVAAILRARTRGPEDHDASIAGEQGAFTDLTRTKYSHVQELIALACGDMAGMLRGRAPCTATLEAACTTAAAYRAAQLVEISYLPDETEDKETATTSLQRLWEGASQAAAVAVIENCPAAANPDGSPSLAGLPTGRVPFRRPTTWAEQF